MLIGFLTFVKVLQFVGQAVHVSNFDERAIVASNLKGFEHHSDEEAREAIKNNQVSRGNFCERATEMTGNYPVMTYSRADFGYHYRTGFWKSNEPEHLLNDLLPNVYQ